ncbi:MAG: CDP-diacylglycerol--glycerol-3-phosphate 3-phosphatidyltransferase [Pacificimonas sp.]
MYSLPNLLTLSRIVVVPVLILVMWQANWPGYLAAFILYTVAGATDYLDGYLARSQGTVSKLGQFLDPIADKVMVVAAIVMLIENDIILGITTLAAMIILLREIVVSGLREFLGGVQVSVPVSKLAKWKTAFQMVSLGALILHGFSKAKMPYLPSMEVGVICLWIAAVLTLITGWDYLRAGLKHMT